MESSWQSEFWAGGIAGAAGVFVGQPFDFVKVRLQTMSTYAGPLDVLRKTLRHEGLVGVYRGTMPPVINSFALNAVVFTGYGHGHRMLEPVPSSHLQRAFWAGTFAGSLSVFALVPFDLVKCQLQVDRAKASGAEFKGMVDCAARIMRGRGIVGLYRGTLITSLRDSWTTGLYFVIFEALEDHLPGRAPGLNSHGSTLVAGGVAGTVTWALAFPIDVVKSKVQTLPVDTPPSAVSLSQLAMATWRKGEMFRGLGCCLLRAFPVNAITFWVYRRVHALWGGVADGGG